MHQCVCVLKVTRQPHLFVGAQVSRDAHELRERKLRLQQRHHRQAPLRPRANHKKKMVQKTA